MEKYIKIFLTLSGTALGNACDELEAFIGTLNNIYIKQNIFFELIKCVDLDDALRTEQKQDEYNSQIRDSQYFYLLFGKSAGKYAKEEFDVALEHFRASGVPKIYTYFKQLPEGESAEKDVLDFMERLDKQLGHYYNMFEHLDAVKLNLILELSQDTQSSSVMEFKDGQALLDKQPVLSLENVPLYCGNETLQQKKTKQKALNEEFTRLVTELSQNPLEEGLMDKAGELGSERKILQEEIHQMEMDMLEMCRETAQKRHLGIQLDWREKKAMELVDQGNYEGAKNLLRDAQWDEEVKQDEEELELLKEMEKEKREKIRKYISGKRTLIFQIKATGLDRQSVKEITDIYENITQKAEKYQLELEVLSEYITFLRSQNRQAEGLAVAERVQKYYENTSKVSDLHKVKFFRDLGYFYLNTGKQDKAEQSFQAVLEICHHLSIEDPKTTEIFLVLSQVYRGVARNFRVAGKMEEAEKFLSQALEISAYLSEREPENDKLCGDWCACMGIWASLQDKMGKKQEAEGLFREVLQVAQRQVRKNFEAYGPYLAATYAELAKILCGTGQLEEAESLYRKGLETLSPFAEKNPEAYEEIMAGFCDDMAALLEDVSKNEEAEGLYQMARTIRFRLASKNPEHYKNSIARNAYNLARILKKQGQMTEAFALYREAQEIYRELYKEAPKLYEVKMAQACYMLAECYSMRAEYADSKDVRLPSYNQAVTLYEEALAIFSRLANEKPESFEDSKAAVCHSLANCMYKNMDNSLKYFRRYRTMAENWETFSKTSKKIERLYRRALEIYRRMYEKNPSYGWKYKMLSCYDSLGILKHCWNHFEEQEKIYKECCEMIREDIASIQRPEMYKYAEIFYLKYSGCLSQMGRAKEAEEMKKKSLEYGAYYQAWNQTDEGESTSL